MFKSQHNRNQKAQKPTFNVNPPFMGVLMVQLNHTMSLELQRFINSIGDVEDEIRALKSGLRDPATNGAYVFKDGPSFLVIRSFKGVVMVEMNEEMRAMLISFISDIEGGVDKIIWAFRLALESPGGRDTSRQSVPAANKRRRIRGAYSGTAEEGHGEYEGDEGHGEYEGDEGHGEYEGDEEYDDEEYDDEEGDEEEDFEDEEVRDEVQPAK